MFLVPSFDCPAFLAAIVSTPLENEDIKERVLLYEPFVGYIPKQHRLSEKKKIDISDLDINDMLLLEDGHCFREVSAFLPSGV